MIAERMGERSVAPGSRSPGSDAELIRLGRSLEAAWAVERRACADADPAWTGGVVEIAACNAIVARIEALTATTLAGLAVKQMAVCWYWFGDPPTAEELAGCQPTADFRLIAGILADLSGMKGSLS